MIFQTSRRYKIDFLDYMITSNHVHFLVWSKKGSEISKAKAFQYLQGQFAQYYNRRKGRQGAFWRDRYHTTLIQSGHHLNRCLFYIDLNMVRAGVIDHSKEWKHCGYHELSNTRKRYRVINQTRLQECLMMTGDEQRFADWYTATLEQSVASAKRMRDPRWTEAYAIGEENWLKDVYTRLGFKESKIHHLLRVEDCG